MTDYNNGITNGYAWYTITGSRQDYMNYYGQCREVTIECSNSKTPNASQLPNFWNINHNSMLTYIEQCTKGVRGIVTDSITGEPIEGALITVSGHDHHGSEVSSHVMGDFYRPIKGGSYTFIISEDGYCPKLVDVTIADGETINLDVQLVPGNCLLPNFNASSTQVALGGSVNFTDGSFGDIVSWEWTFEGGTPSTSTQQNPNGIVYNESGDYDVTLTITDADGNSETLTREAYIQVRESYNMQNGTIETCNALFYDNGGPNNNYNNNRNYTMTFMPAIEGNKIRVNFAEFNTEEGYDYLYIYDGSSTSATLIGQYDGANNPGEVTATNNEGALTFRFTSDQGVTASGWVATISCVGSYDPITLEITADPEVINEGESSQLNVVATGGSGQYTYIWEPAETLDNPNIANPVATPTEPETIYKVVVTDSEGNSESDEITVTIRDWSVTENDVMPNIYPNPNNGTFTINVRGKYSFRLFNSIGQQVMSGDGEGKTVIDASSLNPGVYFLQLTAEGTQVEKIVIEK